MRIHTSLRAFAPLIPAGLAGLLAACGGDGGPAAPAPVASVTVTTSATAIPLAQQVQFSAVLRDESNNVLTGREISWSASPASVGTVSTTGLVTTLATGTLTVTASSEGKSGSVQVSVVNNAPVATVSVSAPVSTLIPQQTTQLTAELRDASNRVLSGRNVSWSAQPPGVGSVSNAGLVTATATGTLSVTATSEGKSSSVQLTVASGGVVGPTGGTLTLAGGDVQITVPAGAVTVPTTITVVPRGAPPVAPPAAWQSVGQNYVIGPAGTQFAQPVTIRLSYETSELPLWVMTGDLRVRQLSGTQWTTLTNPIVDVNARTISGRTTSLGAPSPLFQTLLSAPDARALETAGEDDGGSYEIGAQQPALSITPGNASVNFQQRSAQFSAVLASRGNPVPLSASPTPPLLYRWRTSGQNGALSVATNQWITSTDAQYTATNPVLNQLSGQIDVVMVDVLLNPETVNNPGAQRIITAQATVDADLQLTYEISPSSSTIDAGESKNVQLVIRNREGQFMQLGAGQSIAWATSGNHGSLGAATPTQMNVTYTARTQFQFPPPRVDDVVAKVTEQRTSTQRQWRPAGVAGLMGWQDVDVTRTINLGEAKGFIEVKIEYDVIVSPPTRTIAAGSTGQLTVTLDPTYQGSGLGYKYTYPGTRGTLNVASGVMTSQGQVTYQANDFGGGTDQIQVEVFSVVAGVVLESLGTGQASVTVDPLRPASFSVIQLPTPGGAFVAAQISIPKINGATSYEVTATTPDGPYSKTFSGATSTDQFSVGQVLDGGGSWLINIEAGFNTTPQGIDARRNLYQTKYGGVAFKFKAIR